jgi:TRAP-type uncharacterized transport system substrate-binding protein
MAGGNVIKPKLEKYFWVSLRDELAAISHFLRFQWYIVALIVAAVILIISSYNPLPPSKVRIASGQQDSTLQVFAERFKTIFAEAGVELELVPTRGAIENLEALRDGKVDVAFSQGGAVIPGGAGIVSLGSIGYQPMWFFYSGEPLNEDNVFEMMRGKRLSIGIEGSGTRIIADAVLDLLPRDVKSSYVPIEMAAGESARALQGGLIDGMFLVGGIESGNVQTLLRSSEVHFYDFSMAEGLARQLPFMEVVKVPRGSLDLAPAKPAQDTAMVATTTIILAHEKLHPAIQHLLLKGASKIYNSSPSFFERPGGFPAFIDKSIPRSDIAVRYLQNGPLLLERYLPHWLASFFSVSWFWLVALIAIAFPLVKLIPAYRKVMFDVVLSDLYGELFYMYRKVDHLSEYDHLSTVHAQFDAVREKIKSMWVPKGCTTQYGLLLQALEIVSVKVDTSKLALTKSSQDFHPAILETDAIC